jgi:hypothetical protein
MAVHHIEKELELSCKRGYLLEFDEEKNKEVKVKFDYIAPDAPNSQNFRMALRLERLRTELKKWKKR